MKLAAGAGDAASLVARKNDHLDIVLDDARARTRVATGLADYVFEHCALPELDLDAIDLSTTLFGRLLRAPLLISSMTGGALRATAINRHLAEAAQALGIALAVGSQRVALETPADHGLTRDLRRRAPDVPILANLGAAQLRDGGPDLARRAVEMIDADALIVHLNPLQEAVQRGGDRDWRGILGAIEQLATRTPVPLVAKEVGAGLSPDVARRLWNAGVSVIDVAGAGGTSWAAVEAERARDPADRAVAMAFAGWGIPTARAIADVRQALPEATLIASGGIRDGVDAAKAIALGADLVGQAASLLASAVASTEAVIAHFEIVVRQLRIACFCTSSRDLGALRNAPLRDQRGDRIPPPA
ncbi:type 2 isopentenyl-diphosphate Delta-isomerase [Luteimonas sp. S4-F44]|uniref:type 2 isopentenyl-diphosphate Delta-isomerase n=1 Tax=Luteimonas sp. S4-F44 TaxID=2925842 RepID=UPI001F52BAB5|nr:type 2 isopentenyl-diphosphate Delta-isomerase [Luteimonas sp. S4-F44]UNK42855.1 type 2 isopentenyl-diphosphate Delta-isomerase [Luteimonas sp. S4-F44]